MHELQVVMYHNIHEADPRNPMGHLAFTPRQFEAHLRAYRAAGYVPLHLPEALARAREGTLGLRRHLVLTFDDGFLDNAFEAADLLRRYDMKATVFVNPSFALEGAPRQRGEVPGHLGYLNLGDLRALQGEGLFDVQSHTMTHDRVFLTDEVVDHYRPERYPEHAWLEWLLDPGAKRDWPHPLEGRAGRIPLGYPVFRHGRALAGPRFQPDPLFVEAYCAAVQAGDEARRLDLMAEPCKGVWESGDVFRERVRWEFQRSREVLEEALGKPVTFLCFPGGVCRPEHLDLVAAAGYEGYMVSGRREPGSNLAILQGGAPGPHAIRRISLSRDLPFGHLDWIHRVNCRLKLASTGGSPLARALMGVARTFPRRG